MSAIAAVLGIAMILASGAVLSWGFPRLPRDRHRL